MNKSYIAVAFLSALACSQGDDTLDKRQTKLAEVLDQSNAANADQAPAKSPGSSDGQKAEPQQQQLPLVEFAAPQLSSSKAFEISAEELAQAELMVKVSESELLLASKDGRTWYHKAGSDKALEQLEPIVIAPEGAKLYTLPGEQFWFVSPEVLGRRKADAAVGSEAGAAISVEQFSTKSFQGDVKQIKALYLSVNEIVLHVDTHIAILSIKNGKSLLNQFPIEGLPVDLKGSVKAGKMANDGYWFLANGQLSLLLPGSDGSLAWSKGKLEIPADASHVAMILDSDLKKEVGTSYILGSSGLQSSSK